jgi:hypothetical protein
MVKIPVETVQNFCEFIPSRTSVVLKANVVQHHINKEICTVSVCCHYLFQPLYLENLNTAESVESRVEVEFGGRRRQ